MAKPSCTAPQPDRADAQLVKPLGDALAEFAGTEAARRLARLEADQELVLQLMLRGYDGPEWNKFTHALAEYGVPVITAWVRTGKIFKYCARKRVGGLVPVESSRQGDAPLEIAGETVTEAIVAFRSNVLIPGRWDPTQGASLKTYFIGQCLFRFGNVYRRWCRAQAPERMDTFDAEALRAPPRPALGRLVDLAKEWTSLPVDSVKRMEALVEMGFSHEEIATHLGVSKRSVSSKIFRNRREEIRDE